MDSYHNPSPHAPTIAFLIELRYRFFIYVMFVILMWVALLLFSSSLYQRLVSPMLAHLSVGIHSVPSSSIASFPLSFKLAWSASLLATVPVLLYQLWALIFPNLYRLNDYWLWALLFFSTILFYMGVGIAYLTIFPLLWPALMHPLLAGLPVVSELSYCLSFIIKLFFIFGLVFQVPLLHVLLVLSGLVSVKRLRQFRFYFISIVFVIAVLIVPFTIKSQLVFVLPLWLLFEVGIVLASICRRVFGAVSFL